MGVQIIALNSQTPDCPFNLLLKIFFKKYNKLMIGYYPKLDILNPKENKVLEIRFISALRIYQNIE
jgi:hypothetical protein